MKLMAKKSSKQVKYTYIVEFPATVTIRQVVQIQAETEAESHNILKQQIAADDFETTTYDESHESGILDSHRNISIQPSELNHGNFRINDYYKADLKKVSVYQPNTNVKNSYNFKDLSAEDINDRNYKEHNLEKIKI